MSRLLSSEPWSVSATKSTRSQGADAFHGIKQDDGAAKPARGEQVAEYVRGRAPTRTSAYREIAVPRLMRGARPGKPGRQTAGASSRTPQEERRKGFMWRVHGDPAPRRWDASPGGKGRDAFVQAIRLILLSSHN
jgi:hypothetical protein